MIPISKDVYYLIGGGVSYLILKDVIKFVKWTVDRITGNGKTTVENIMDKNDREVLESIFNKIENVKNCMQELEIDFVETKTKINFMAETIKKQNGSITESTKKINEIATSFTTTVAVCQQRFENLEKKLGG